jgi:phosphoribosylformylglycinamidine cyclo-ligase
MSKITYADSGVDINVGDEFVEIIKRKIKHQPRGKLRDGVGGFACLYEVAPNKFLAAGCDGVGTKLKIAQKLNIHHTIGIDLVAMCVNDIICTGASPTLFMDYLAQGKIDLKVNEKLIEGIIEGCDQSEMILAGGETAEMPDIYAEGVYDLAGFALGEVYEEDVIDGKNINSGDILVGIASSGLHSNGFSLVRKVIKDNEIQLLKEALTPTRIYHQFLKKLYKSESRKIVKGLSHITGSGWQNIPRMNESLNYEYTYRPGPHEIPKIISTVVERAGLSMSEAYDTFNMGVGLVIATSDPKKILNFSKDFGYDAWEIGKIS